eukprot:bmy_18009T0
MKWPMWTVGCNLLCHLPSEKGEKDKQKLQQTDAQILNDRQRDPEARLARPPPPWPPAPPGRPSSAMIKAILIFNNHGKPRLSKFYQPYSEDAQQQIIRETFHLVSKRDENAQQLSEDMGNDDENSKNKLHNFYIPEVEYPREYGHLYLNQARTLFALPLSTRVVLLPNSVRNSRKKESYSENKNPEPSNLRSNVDAILMNYM